MQCVILGFDRVAENIERFEDLKSILFIKKQKKSSLT